MSWRVSRIYDGSRIIYMFPRFSAILAVPHLFCIDSHLTVNIGSLSTFCLSLCTISSKMQSDNFFMRSTRLALVLNGIRQK